MTHSRYVGAFLVVSVALFGLRIQAFGKEPDKNKAAPKPLVLIINYPYQIWHTDTSKIHVVLFTPHFKPAAGAVVKVAGKEVGKTDDNGVCIFDFKPGARRARILTAELKSGGKTYRVTKSFRCNSRTVSFRSEQLYVYTDRGVYNPGQDVLIRLMAWELKGEYAPIADGKVEILFQNTKGKIFSGGRIKTNEFGIGTMKLPLPFCAVASTSMV